VASGPLSATFSSQASNPGNATHHSYVILIRNAKRKIF